MKKYFFLFLFTMFLMADSSAQTSWDQRLLSRYAESELAEMKKSDPAKLEYLNKVVRSGWQIMDLPSQKADAHEIRGTVEIKDMKNVDLFALGLFPETKNYQYYRIAGTSKMLVVLSEEMIRSSK